MILDLDGFKLINDTHGHGVGDELLVGIANTAAPASAHLGLHRSHRAGPLSRGPPTL